LFLLLLCPGVVGAFALRLDLGRVVHPAFQIDGLQLTIGSSGGPAELLVARLSVGTERWERLRLTCPDFGFDGGVVRCRGTLAAPRVIEGAAVDLLVDSARRSGHLRLSLPDGESLHIVARADGHVQMQASRLKMMRLAGWWPPLARWQPSGFFDGRIDYAVVAGEAHASVTGRLVEGGFAAADGLQAGEKLALTVDVRARSRRAGWDWEGRAAWTGGEAYWHPLYLTAGAVIEARGRMDARLLTVAQASMQVEGARTVAASAEFDLARGTLRRGALTVADADLAVIGPRYLVPLLAPAKADALRFAGHVSAGLAFENESLQAADLAFDEAGISLTDDRMSFGPLSGTLPWRAGTATQARLTIGGGRWQKLTLGAFEVAARLDGNDVAVDRVTIPVLDGALVLENLALRRGPGGWTGHGGVVVEPVSMQRLTEATGLPSMRGVLSASLPGLRVAPGEIALDGALVISVFDGYLQATRLQVLEPFGVASRLYADVEARRLDLAQLTETFSFGSVSGFIDADVNGLELVHWRPVRFAARVSSSPGNYPRRISQRAVQNISALGGPGAVAAIQRSMLGVFDTFGYREMGVSCVLADGVCSMGGVDGMDGAVTDDATRKAGGRTDGGFPIVRGGGIPALNVIGYNRQVDWNELIERLRRVIESNVAPVIK
jgi:hypothetical protein